MIHTYRDQNALGRRFFGSGFAGILLFCASVVGLFAVTGFPFTRDDCEVLGGFFGLLLVLYTWGFLYEVRHWCAEIRLDDDCSCELETKRRTFRLHVNQIQSVRYSPETDESSEHYTIHHRDGTLHVSKQMTGFPTSSSVSRR